MSQPKVFGIGFSKTGTTTLAKMMERLGYLNYGYDYYFLRLISEKRIDEIWKWVDPWQSFQDTPWPLIYRELDQRYPGSKFILTIRDEEKWWNSFLKHKGGRSLDFTRMVFGESDPVGKKDLFLNVYKNHNDQVRSYFAERPDDLLVVDWERDGWTEICTFLGKKHPVHRFSGKKLATGHYNKAEKRDQRSYLTNFFRRKVKTQTKKAVISLFGFPAITFFGKLRFVRYWIKQKYLSILYKTS